MQMVQIAVGEDPSRNARSRVRAFPEAYEGNMWNDAGAGRNSSVGHTERIDLLDKPNWMRANDAESGTRL